MKIKISSYIGLIILFSTLAGCGSGTTALQGTTHTKTQNTPAPFNGWIMDTALSNDESKFAIATTKGLYIYRADNYEQVWYRTGGEQNTGVNAVAFPFEGNKVSAAMGDYKVLDFDSETGEKIGETTGLGGGCFAVSPDGNAFAECTSMGIDTLAVYYLNKAIGITIPIGLDLNPISLAWSRDGKTLAVGVGDGTYQFYTFSLENEKINLELKTPPMNGQELSSINELVWSKDGKTLAALTNTGGISLILPEKGEYLKSYLGLNTHLNEYPQGLDYGPGEKEIAFGCENKICILNLDTEKVRTINVEGQTSKTIALFWIKGTNVIGSASKEKVILVDAVSGNVVKTFLSTN